MPVIGFAVRWLLGRILPRRAAAAAAPIVTQGPSGSSQQQQAQPPRDRVTISREARCVEQPRTLPNFAAW